MLLLYFALLITSEVEHLSSVNFLFIPFSPFFFLLIYSLFWIVILCFIYVHIFLPPPHPFILSLVFIGICSWKLV